MGKTLSLSYLYSAQHPIPKVASMPLDPETKPKEFLTVMVAIGLRLFGRSANAEDAIQAAKHFVKEVEKEFGPL